MPQQTLRTLSPLGPPADINIGPLTRAMISGARWQGLDAFPAWQVWADDVESVLQFLDTHQRFPAFLDRIQKERNVKHRDATLAEARGSYYLHQNGFSILEWEPLGEGTALGEALVQLGSSPAVFVEVKQPSWQGENLPLMTADQNRLSPADRAARLARMKQARFLPGVCEGGAVGSHHYSMSVVRRNALHKLSVRHPNLVIVADECQVTPVGLPALEEYVQQEFLTPAHDPLDLDDRYTYERLGGVLFLNLVSFGTGVVEYNAEFVENPNVIQSCALPAEVISLLGRLTAETQRRDDQRYAGSSGIWEAIRNRAANGTTAAV
jgi:hypothetical protein